MRKLRLLPARLVIAAALLIGIVPAIAADYPDRPVTLVIPFDAGGSADLVGRILADGLKERLGQPVIVENRPGAGGAIGTSYAAKATPDGYTLLFGTVSTHAINVAVYEKLPYDPVKDFEPIIEFGTVPYVLVVPAALDVKTVADFATYAKGSAERLKYGSAGVGTANHLAGALLASNLGFKAVHVPYRGGSQAITALLGGETSYMFYPYLPLLPHVKAGTLRALAITSDKRIDALADVPTMTEAAVKDFEISGFFAAYAPKGTPAYIVTRLHADMSAIINSPAVQEKLRAQGVDPVSGSSEDLARLMATEIQRWNSVAQAAGARQK